MLKKQLSLALLSLFIAGCSGESEPESKFVYVAPTGPRVDPYAVYDVSEIRFIDNAASNVELSDAVLSSQFIGLDSAEYTPADLAADSHLVLVILRGYTDPICPACTRQTAQIISSYPEFVNRGAQVAVVYPIENDEQRASWENLLQNARTQLESADQPVPFTLLFDVGLAAITELGLQDKLSKPATYIINRDGEVVFAYEGKGAEDIMDRPSIESILAQLDLLATPESTETQSTESQSASDDPAS